MVFSICAQLDNLKNNRYAVLMSANQRSSFHTKLSHLQGPKAENQLQLQVGIMDLQLSDFVATKLAALVLSYGEGSEFSITTLGLFCMALTLSSISLAHKIFRQTIP